MALYEPVLAAIDANRASLWGTKCFGVGVTRW
jgi:hypothetical protein